MKIRALRLWNVRRFADRGIAIENIGDGVNVLAAENERGKSTCFDALHALLFQAHSGTPKPVQMLRPYSGGSPWIEADIETAEGLFRVAKQYYSGKKALVTDLGTDRLVAQADQAEAWISDLVDGGASGPTGLLWVRQGITDFDSGGNAQRAQELKARENVFSSVAGEVEALTGGRRMARIIETCKAELGAYVTAVGRPKKGGPYANAIDTLEHLMEEERAQKDLVDALRGALDGRKRLTARCAELVDPAAIERRRLEKERTVTALDLARRHADALSEALKKRQVETERHAGALEKFNRFRDALDRSVVLLAEIDDKTGAHAVALTARDVALAAEQDAEQALQSAETEMNAARSGLRRAEAARHAQEARVQLSERRTTLGKAEESRRAIEQLAARGQALAIPDDAITKLEALDAEISSLRAARAAAAVTVTVDHAAGRAGAILVDGKPIADGVPWTVSRSQRFDIMDIGALTVSAGAGDEKTESDALRAKQEDFRQGVEALDVTDLAAARERRRRYMEITADLRVARAELSALAPKGIDTLRARISQLEALIEESGADIPDIELATQRLESAETCLKEARTVRETARTRMTDTREAALRHEHIVERLRDERDRSGEILGPEDGWQAELEKLTEAKALVTASLGTAVEQAEAVAANAPDLATAEAAARRAISVVEGAEAETARLEKEISELTGLIKARSDDAVEEIYAETRDRRAAAENRVTALETEIAVLNRLKKALEDARGAAHEQYFGAVMEEIKPLLALLLEEGEITFDNGTLLPRSLARNGQDEDISVLSGGIREQLSILTRLAFARLLAKGRAVRPGHSR